MNTQDKEIMLGHLHHIQSRCKIIERLAPNPANDELLCVLLEDNFTDIQSLIAEYCTNGWTPFSKSYESYKDYYKKLGDRK